MIPLESLRAEQFQPLVGRSFRVILEGQAIDLCLSEVSLTGAKWPDAIRDPFVLSFCGPSGLHLPQAIYRFEVPELGEMECFITQVKATGPQGSQFEAIFT